MNKIEMTIPRITNLYPETSDIKKFANSYSNSDWNKLCLDRQFNNFVMEDLSKAEQRAESILGKRNEIVKIKNNNFANPS